MRTVQSIMNEAYTKSLCVPSMSYATINSSELEDGIIVVSGDYDQDEDLITVYFITSGNEDVEFSGDYEDLVHEINKTYLHENIHREQWYAGEDTLRPAGETHEEYMLSKLEVEARARVDIPMDLKHYGKSEDFEEYMSYFNKGLKGSYDAVMFIEQTQTLTELRK
jgi:hypothetical protein